MRKLFALLIVVWAAPAIAQAPGDCFALVFIPPRYETQVEQVLKTPATEQIKKIPARYEWVKEDVVVPAGRVAVVVKPAVYEWTEERVQVASAGEQQVRIPPRYKTVREKVVTRTGSVTKLGQQVKGSGGSEAILCTVEEPIEYKWVERKVLVTPARIERVQVEDRFKTVKRKKLVMPAETKWVMAPERLRTRRVKRLVEPAREVSVPVPAVYETVTKQVLVTPARSDWREALCDTNVTPALITQVQRKLHDQGFYQGQINGRLSRQTQAAIREFQASMSMPQSGLDLETLRKLGLKT